VDEVKDEDTDDVVEDVKDDAVVEMDVLDVNVCVEDLVVE